MSQTEPLPRPSNGGYSEVLDAAHGFIEAAARATDAHPIPMRVHNEMAAGIANTMMSYVDEWKAERDAA